MSKYYRHTPLLAPGPNGSLGHSPPLPVDDKSINFAEVWSAVRRGKWIILLTTLLITAAVTGYTRTLDLIFEAGSIVSIEMGGSRTVPIGPSSENVISFGIQRSLQGELGVLQNSVELAERVVQRLEAAAAALGTDQYFPVLRPEEGETPTTRNTALRVMSRVQFQGYSAQSMISVTAESTFPEEAASIANFYAVEYEKYSRERSRASVVAAREFLEEQVEGRWLALQRLENQWEAFAREKEVLTQGQVGERAVAEYTALSTRRDEAQFALEQERFWIELLQQQLEQVEPDLEEKMLQEHVASELESQIEALDRRLADLRIDAEQYYAVTPELRGNEAQVPQLEELVNHIENFTTHKAKLTNQLVAEILRDTIAAAEGGQLGYVNSLRRRITERQLAARELRAQNDALTARLRSYESTLQGIPRQVLQGEQLERKLVQAEQWYNTFEQQLQQTLIAEEAELGYVKIVRNAFVPYIPVRPDVRQNIILGFLLGIGFGIGLAFVRQAVRTKLGGPRDLTEHGYHLLGIVPRMDRQIKAVFGGKEMVELEGKQFSTRLITHLDPWSPISENYRFIRANIESHEPDKPIRSLLITSPEDADGKSVTAVNTAIAMAQSGRRTLLIDADLRRPDIHRLIGLERRPGLADILQGQHPFDEADFATGIPGLHCVPAGHLSRPPGELFGTENMRHLLESVREQFDIVIIDSPPVLVVTDAVVLAPQCDAAVIVVAADKTDLRALEVTQETLSNLGVPVIGTIINRFDARKVGGYKYGYGYYRYYYSTEQA